MSNNPTSTDEIENQEPQSKLEAFYNDVVAAAEGLANSFIKKAEARVPESLIPDEELLRYEAHDEITNKENEEVISEQLMNNGNGHVVARVKHDSQNAGVNSSKQSLHQAISITITDEAAKAIAANFGQNKTNLSNKIESIALEHNEVVVRGHYPITKATHFVGHVHETKAAYHAPVGGVIPPVPVPIIDPLIDNFVADLFDQIPDDDLDIPVIIDAPIDNLHDPILHDQDIPVDVPVDAPVDNLDGPVLDQDIPVILDAPVNNHDHDPVPVPDVPVVNQANSGGFLATILNGLNNLRPSVLATGNKETNPAVEGVLSEPKSTIEKPASSIPNVDPLVDNFLNDIMPPHEEPEKQNVADSSPTFVEAATAEQQLGFLALLNNLRPSILVTGHQQGPEEGKVSSVQDKEVKNFVQELNGLDVSQSEEDESSHTQELAEKMAFDVLEDDDNEELSSDASLEKPDSVTTFIEDITWHQTKPNDGGSIWEFLRPSALKDRVFGGKKPATTTTSEELVEQSGKYHVSLSNNDEVVDEFVEQLFEHKEIVEEKNEVAKETIAQPDAKPTLQEIAQEMAELIRNEEQPHLELPGSAVLVGTPLVEQSGLHQDSSSNNDGVVDNFVAPKAATAEQQLEFLALLNNLRPSILLTGHQQGPNEGKISSVQDKEVKNFVQELNGLDVSQSEEDESSHTQELAEKMAFDVLEDDDNEELSSDASLEKHDSVTTFIEDITWDQTKPTDEGSIWEFLRPSALKDRVFGGKKPATTTTSEELVEQSGKYHVSLSNNDEVVDEFVEQLFEHKETVEEKNEVAKETIAQPDAKPTLQEIVQEMEELASVEKQNDDTKETVAQLDAKPTLQEIVQEMEELASVEKQNEVAKETVVQPDAKPTLQEIVQEMEQPDVLVQNDVNANSHTAAKTSDGLTQDLETVFSQIEMQGAVPTDDYSHLTIDEINDEIEQIERELAAYEEQMEKQRQLKLQQEKKEVAEFLNQLEEKSDKDQHAEKQPNEVQKYDEAEALRQFEEQFKLQAPLQDDENDSYFVLPITEDKELDSAPVTDDSLKQPTNPLTKSQAELMAFLETLSDDNRDPRLKEQEATELEKILVEPIVSKIQPEPKLTDSQLAEVKNFVEDVSLPIQSIVELSSVEKQVVPSIVISAPVEIDHDVELTSSLHNASLSIEIGEPDLDLDESFSDTESTQNGYLSLQKDYIGLKMVVDNFALNNKGLKHVAEVLDQINPTIITQVMNELIKAPNADLIFQAGVEIDLLKKRAIDASLSAHEYVIETAGNLAGVKVTTYEQAIKILPTINPENDQIIDFLVADLKKAIEIADALHQLTQNVELIETQLQEIAVTFRDSNLIKEQEVAEFLNELEEQSDKKQQTAKQEQEAEALRLLEEQLKREAPVQNDENDSYFVLPTTAVDNTVNHDQQSKSLTESQIDLEEFLSQLPDDETQPNKSSDLLAQDLEDLFSKLEEQEDEQRQLKLKQAQEEAAEFDKMLEELSAKQKIDEQVKIELEKQAALEEQAKIELEKQAALEEQAKIELEKQAALEEQAKIELEKQAALEEQAKIELEKQAALEEQAKLEELRAELKLFQEQEAAELAKQLAEESSSVSTKESTDDLLAQALEEVFSKLEEQEDEQHQLKLKQDQEQAAEFDKMLEELSVKQKLEEQAKLELEEQAKLELEEQAKLELEEQAKLELEEQARLELEEQARLELEEQARLELEEQARLELEEQARLEEQVIRELEAQTKLKLFQEQEAAEFAKQLAEKPVSVPTVTEDDVQQGISLTSSQEDLINNAELMEYFSSIQELLEYNEIAKLNSDLEPNPSKESTEGKAGALTDTQLAAVESLVEDMNSPVKTILIEDSTTTVNDPELVQELSELRQEVENIQQELAALLEQEARLDLEKQAKLEEQAKLELEKQERFEEQARLEEQAKRQEEAANVDRFVQELVDVPVSTPKSDLVQSILEISKAPNSSNGSLNKVVEKTVLDLDDQIDVYLDSILPVQTIVTTESHDDLLTSILPNSSQSHPVAESTVLKMSDIIHTSTSIEQDSTVYVSPIKLAKEGVERAKAQIEHAKDLVSEAQLEFTLLGEQDIGGGESLYPKIASEFESIRPTVQSLLISDGKDAHQNAIQARELKDKAVSILEKELKLAHHDLFGTSEESPSIEVIQKKLSELTGKNDSLSLSSLDSEIDGKNQTPVDEFELLFSNIEKQSQSSKYQALSDKIDYLDYAVKAWNMLSAAFDKLDATQETLHQAQELHTEALEHYAQAEVTQFNHEMFSDTHVDLHAGVQTLQASPIAVHIEPVVPVVQTETHL